MPGERTYFYFSVQPPWPPQCWVQSIGAIRSGDDDDVALLLPAIKPIHESEQRGDYPPLHLTRRIVASAGFSPGSKRIDLVDDDDRRRVFFSFRKDLSQSRFGATMQAA